MTKRSFLRPMAAVPVEPVVSGSRSDSREARFGSRTFLGQLLKESDPRVGHKMAGFRDGGPKLEHHIRSKSENHACVSTKSAHPTTNAGSRRTTQGSDLPSHNKQTIATSQEGGRQWLHGQGRTSPHTDMITWTVGWMSGKPDGHAGC